MNFNAKLCIQGTANYVPHEAGDQLCILFPDSESALGKRMRDWSGEPICTHHTVVQFSGECVGMPADLWVTLPMKGYRMGFDVKGSSGGLKGLDRLGDASVGLWNVRDVLADDKLSQYQDLVAGALPGSGEAPPELAGSLTLRTGELHPRQAEGEWKVHRGDGNESSLSGKFVPGIIEVELKGISGIDLVYHRLGAPGDIGRLTLKSGTKPMEIWVRNFCKITDPAQDVSVPTGDVDEDFPLNFLLRENASDLEKKRKNKLPHPRLHKILKGVDPARCMGTLDAPKAFESAI